MENEDKPKLKPRLGSWVKAVNLKTGEEVSEPTEQAKVPPHRGGHFGNTYAPPGSRVRASDRLYFVTEQGAFRRLDDAGRPLQRTRMSKKERRRRKEELDAWRTTTDRPHLPPGESGK